MSKIDFNGVIREMTTEEESAYMGEKREENEKNDENVQ